MSFEPTYVEKLFEVMEVTVDLTEVFVPDSFNEAKRHEKRLPDRLVNLSKASDAKYSGGEVVEMVNTIDEQIGRLLTVKKNIMDTFQDTIVEYEEKKPLENLS